MAPAPAEVETTGAADDHRATAGCWPMDAALRSSGHYGPRVEVPAGADAQTRLLAFAGRTP